MSTPVPFPLLAADDTGLISGTPALPSFPDEWSTLHQSEAEYFSPLARLGSVADFLSGGDQFHSLHLVHDLPWIVHTSMYSMSELMNTGLRILASCTHQGLPARALQITSTTCPHTNSVRLTINEHSIAVDIDCDNGYRFDGDRAAVDHVLQTFLLQFPGLCASYGRISLALEGGPIPALPLSVSHTAGDLIDHIFGSGDPDLCSRFQKHLTLTVAVRRCTVQFSTGNSPTGTPLLLIFHIELAAGNSETYPTLPLYAAMNCTLTPALPSTGMTARTGIPLSGFPETQQTESTIHPWR